MAAYSNQQGFTQDAFVNSLNYAAPPTPVPPSALDSAHGVHARAHSLCNDIIRVAEHLVGGTIQMGAQAGNASPSPSGILPTLQASAEELNARLSAAFEAIERIDRALS